jgi:hypothetical protein
MWRHVGHGVMNFARKKETNKQTQFCTNYKQQHNPLLQESYNRQVKEKQE